VEGASPSQDGLHVAAAQGQALLQFQEGEHLGVSLPVTAEELLRLRLTHSRLTGKPLGTHAVDHAEVDRLAQSALIGAHRVFVEQQTRGQRMHVVAVPVGLLEHFLPGEMGEDAQLDLRVVSTEQRPVLLWQEGLADASAVFRANGDVLQVGVAAAEATGGGHGLVEIRVHTAGLGFHKLGQGIHVGALELAEHAVFKHQRHHRVIAFQFLQHRGIGAVTGFGPP